jgi:hypothetical protein
MGGNGTGCGASRRNSEPGIESKGDNRLMDPDARLKNAVSIFSRLVYWSDEVIRTNVLRSGQEKDLMDIVREFQAALIAKE